MNMLYISVDADKKTNETILKVIKDNKNSVMDGSFSENDKTELAKIAKYVKKTDAIVFESTNVTFDAGRILTLAVFQHKPILILQKKGASKNIELGANRLINKKTYTLDNTSELGRKVSDFMKAVSRQRLTYRFNLMLSRDINSYLGDKAKGQGISKADYIRSLIAEDMSNL